MTTPAEALIAWRKRRGLSQHQLAALLDVNKMTVWKWEQGVNPLPRMAELAVWALEHGAQGGPR